MEKALAVLNLVFTLLNVIGCVISYKNEKYLTAIFSAAVSGLGLAATIVCLLK